MAAMAASGGRPVVLVGHSMGGRVVMAAAAAHPTDIAALVIEDIDLTPRSYVLQTTSHSLLFVCSDKELATTRCF